MATLYYVEPSTLHRVRFRLQSLLATNKNGIGIGIGIGIRSVNVNKPSHIFHSHWNFNIYVIISY